MVSGTRQERRLKYDLVKKVKHSRYRTGVAQMVPGS